MIESMVYTDEESNIVEYFILHPKISGAEERKQLIQRNLYLFEKWNEKNKTRLLLKGIGDAD